MAAARIVQLSDTHFSSRIGPPPWWADVVAWLRADPPDLTVHTGDVVEVDPDDEADRLLSRALLDELPPPLAVIPGNHDVGFYGEEEHLARRLDAFRSTWGDDRFVADVGTWRVVGANAYLLGTPDHDAWLRAAAGDDGPVAVFVHQPVDDPDRDGWEMPASARAAFEAALSGADVRLVASGHRHRSRSSGRAVWAPSLTLTGDGTTGDDPRPGLVEHALCDDGSHVHRVVRPWAISR